MAYRGPINFENQVETFLDPNSRLIKMPEKYLQRLWMEMSDEYKELTYGDGVLQYPGNCKKSYDELNFGF